MSIEEEKYLESNQVEFEVIEQIWFCYFNNEMFIHCLFENENVGFFFVWKNVNVFSAEHRQC